MSDFISAVVNSTKEYEAPQRFYYWAALSSISAVLKDSVWFDMGKQYKEYPNIYTLLFGPSGVRKGPAISLAAKMVGRLNSTKVIEGRASIEAIMSELGKAVTVEGKKGVLKDPCGFVVASELSSSIITNPQAMDIMTELYDRLYRDGIWKYRLKTQDSVTLKNPTITWLAGTNEALFKEFLPEKNIHGGLIGRMFIIAEDKPNRRNSLMYSPEVYPDIDSLCNLLKPSINLRGEFEMPKEIRADVDKWYLDFMANKAPLIKDETGFVSRVLDFVIKVAMLISCGRRGDMVLRKDDIEESMNEVLPLILPTKRVSRSLKKEDRSEVTKRGRILAYIVSQEGYKCSRTDILRSLYPEINSEDLDKTIQLLIDMKVAGSEGNGMNVTYFLKMENKKVKEWIEGSRK